MSSGAPEVSIVMATNRVDGYFQRALLSCVTQEEVEFEVLVVLNGEALEHRIEIEQSWRHDKRVRVLATGLKHINHSLNIGIDAARAELIARMDADDISYKFRLSRQLEFMRTHPEVVVCGASYALIDDSDRAIRIVLPPFEDKAIRRALYFGNPICHPTAMLRRTPILKAGGYLGGVFAEDYDLWLRLARDGANAFANISCVCLGYRSNAQGEARRSRVAYSAMAASQFRNFAMGDGVGWGAAAALTLMKSVIRSSSRQRRGQVTAPGC